MNLLQNTARNVLLKLFSSTDHITALTGATLTVTISKNGAAFGSISPTVTERGNGWYSLALAAGDADTVGDLVVRATATGADPAERILNVIAVPLAAADVWAAGSRTLSTAPPTAVQVRQEMDSNSTKLAYLDASILSRMATFAYTAPDSASAIATAVWLAGGRGLTDKAGFSLATAPPTAAENAAGLLDLANGVETSWTLREAVRIILASAAGKLSGADTDEVQIRNVTDNKTRITADVDEHGNRSGVTFDKS